MSGLWALYAMGALCALVAAMLWAVIRAASRSGAAEANAEAERRQAENLKQSERVRDEIVARMAEADAASVGDNAAAARQRMRKRDPRTR